MKEFLCFLHLCCALWTMRTMYVIYGRTYASSIMSRCSGAETKSWHWWYGTLCVFWAKNFWLGEAHLVVASLLTWGLVIFIFVRTKRSSTHKIYLGLIQSNLLEKWSQEFSISRRLPDPGLTYVIRTLSVLVPLLHILLPLHCIF